ncbi:MAG: DUF6057 family protein [Bacteroidales bacterium]|nr:DUF6057 family protein [Bacteroidales bacterium]
MEKTKLTAALLALAAFVFWAFVRPEWLNFHEQYQMFLFSWDYLAEHLSLPGGMSVYFGEFLVQFFYNTYLGAAVVSAVLVALFWLSVKVSQRYNETQSLVPLQLLAPALLWIYAGDINMLFTFPVAMLGALAFSLAFIRLESDRKIWIQILLLPLVYWLIGYGVWIYAVLTGFDIIKNSVRKFNTVLVVVGQVLFLVFFIFWVAYFPVRNYPFVDLFFGIDSYRERMIIPFWQHLTAVCCAVVPLVGIKSIKDSHVVYYGLVASVAVLTVVGIIIKYENERYDYYKVEYYVRTQQWERLLDFAKKNNLKSDMAATGVNLALAMTEQLPDRLFEFHQPGNEGFLSTFDYNLLSCGPTAEACHYLGLNNSVLRYNFDMQSAILNCKYSGRFFRRIAESYILNRRYDVAQRYLTKLKKTLFYRSWALKAEDCLYDEAKVMENPEWARIAKLRYEDGLNFSHSHLDQMLIFLFENCPENRMALDYSLCSSLVNRDLATFVKNFPCYTKYFGVANIPEIYQQAFALVCFQSNYSIDQMPDFISPKVKADLMEFDQTFLLNPNSKAFTTGKFANSFWKYYLIDGKR